MKDLLVVLFLLTGLFSAATEAGTTEFRDLAAEIHGNGHPVVMIPGLNSAASTWKETCAAVQPAECHMLHLPGFAGREPVEADRFLEYMRDQVIAYVRDRGLENPLFVGHSLGGVLSMMVAIEAPGVVGRLVVVDSLPFLTAIRDPSVTAESVEQIAQNMRDGMLNAPEGQYRAQARANVSGMSLSAERVRTLEAWGESSARIATAQAMYELMTTDLREAVAAIRQPTIVLGSWAAYAQHGATRESTTLIFDTQYARLDGYELRMSEGGYHFLMWDDPELVVNAIREQLAP